MLGSRTKVNVLLCSLSMSTRSVLNDKVGRSDCYLFASKGRRNDIVPSLCTDRELGILSQS